MVINADCVEYMNSMPPNSIDSIVTDPPYGLEFMGKEWDRLRGDVIADPASVGGFQDGAGGNPFSRSRVRYGRGAEAQSWHYAWAVEALRVAKPGAYLLAFGGTRTFHRLAVAIEDAGWEIRDTVMWVYGSGFPKSHNVGKGIDKAAGAEREVVGHGRSGRNLSRNGHKGDMAIDELHQPPIAPDITAPATVAAEQWEGWGTALKPAWEPIIVARKPLEGTVAANVLAHGTGAINIDGCRVAGPKHTQSTSHAGGQHGRYGSLPARGPQVDAGNGRWPANLIHDGSDEVVKLFPDTGKSTGGRIGKKSMGNVTNVPAGQYEKGDPGFGDTGSAARFFYCAKTNKNDRNEGLDEFEDKENAHSTYGIHSDEGLIHNNRNPENRTRAQKNHHPTVKPTALMRYLCKLVTRTDGIVLDPFCGSGSTGKAAILEGFRFIGIEKDPEYYKIADARINFALKSLSESTDTDHNELKVDELQVGVNTQSDMFR